MLLEEQLKIAPGQSGSQGGLGNIALTIAQELGEIFLLEAVHFQFFRFPKEPAGFGTFPFP